MDQQVRSTLVMSDRSGSYWCADSAEPTDTCHTFMIRIIGLLTEVTPLPLILTMRRRLVVALHRTNLKISPWGICLESRSLMCGSRVFTSCEYPVIGPRSLDSLQTYCMAPRSVALPSLRLSQTCRHLISGTTTGCPRISCSRLKRFLQSCP